MKKRDGSILLMIGTFKSAQEYKKIKKKKKQGA